MSTFKVSDFKVGDFIRTTNHWGVVTQVTKLTVWYDYHNGVKRDSNGISPDLIVGKVTREAFLHRIRIGLTLPPMRFISAPTASTASTTSTASTAYCYASISSVP